MSDLGSSDSPQVKLTHEWAQTFKTKDIDLIAKTLHKDYRQITYPRSLEVPGKVIIHSTNKIKTSIGVGTTHESIFIVHIVTDEDGSLKIKQVENFMDSKAHLDFVQAVAAAKAEK